MNIKGAVKICAAREVRRSFTTEESFGFPVPKRIIPSVAPTDNCIDIVVIQSGFISAIHTTDTNRLINAVSFVRTESQ